MYAESKRSPTQYCHTRPQLTNLDQLKSASADKLGPQVALYSTLRPSTHPTVRHRKTLKLTRPLLTTLDQLKSASAVYNFKKLT